MVLRDLLNAKGWSVETISPLATVDDAVQQLVANNVGSLVVCDPDQPGRLIGIITERDILRLCARRPRSLDEVRVGTCMTREVTTAALGDSIEAAMALMTERRIRHLPVIDDGLLVGLISIGDIVKAELHDMTLENHYLRTYIQGQ